VRVLTSPAINRGLDLDEQTVLFEIGGKLKKFFAALIVATLLVSVNSAPASAASCTKAEVNALGDLDFEVGMASITGDLTDFYKQVARSKKSTKKKSLKDFFTKVERVISSENGVWRTGPSANVRKELRNKLQYRRC